MLAVLSLGALIGSSLWVLRPFLGPLIWATMIVVATWPLLLSIQARLWNRRWLAATLLSAALLLLLVVPLSLAVAAIVEHADKLIGWGKALSNFSLPPPPAWLAELPLVGAKAAAAWTQFAATRPEELAAKLTPYAAGVASWLGAQAGNAGLIIMQFLLTVVLAAILYLNGEPAAAGVLRFGHRLAGERGEAAVRLAGRAIRGVAMGIVVTALVQSVLGGIGLALAGVPFAVILSAVMFVLCIAQLGPILVLGPAVAWVYWSGDNVWGTVLLVWTVVVVTLDNLLRPLLIRKGADLPLLLIFGGVVGGLIAFGLIGIFVGPVVLAVTYRLLDAWMNETRSPLDVAPPGEIKA